MNHEYVSIAGIRIHFQVEGSGPPLVLIHGFGEFAETWMSNIGLLGGHYQVYAFELPGHGLSDEPVNNYGLCFDVKFLKELLDTLGIQKASVIGHSLGGFLSLDLAMDFPEMIDKLVLVDSGDLSGKIPVSFKLSTLPGIGSFIGDIMLGPRFLVSRPVIKLAMKRQFYDPGLIAPEWIDAAYRHLKNPARNRTLLNLMKTFIDFENENANSSVADWLSGVTQPVLIIHGKQDRVVPVHQAHNLCNMIPDAQLQILDRCGHNPQLEQAAEFNELVLSFLKQPEA